MHWAMKKEIQSDLQIIFQLCRRFKPLNVLSIPQCFLKHLIHSQNDIGIRLLRHQEQAFQITRHQYIIAIDKRNISPAT